MGVKTVEIIMPLRGINELSARDAQPQGTTFGQSFDDGGTEFQGVLNVFPFDKFRVTRLASRPGFTLAWTIPTSAPSSGS